MIGFFEEKKIKKLLSLIIFIFPFLLFNNSLAQILDERKEPWDKEILQRLEEEYSEYLEWFYNQLPVEEIKEIKEAAEYLGFKKIDMHKIQFQKRIFNDRLFFDLRKQFPLSKRNGRTFLEYKFSFLLLVRGILSVKEKGEEGSFDLIYRIRY
ncbi:MAG: hypothetical protein AB1393_08010 [Candidatus Edwardsbacteria bacterium]